jgi:hypothetical protein
MSHPSRKRKQSAHCTYQMPIAFPTTKEPLNADERSKIVALLSRLILQVASALKHSEVSDDS